MVNYLYVGFDLIQFDNTNVYSLISLKKYIFQHLPEQNTGLEIYYFNLLI